MFAGRSTKSLKSFKKTHASSLSSVLYALWACVFLIVVLSVDVTWSMSLDKLALERNVILEPQPDSPISDNDGSAVDDMQLEAEQGNTDLFVLLPTNNHDDVGDIDRNTIDVGAQEHGSDMLMMETNDEPAMEIVAAVEPALAAALNDVEKIKEVTNDEEQLVLPQQDQQQLVEVETPAKVAVATEEDTPIALLLAEPAMEQEQAETLNENSKTEALDEQIKMVEIPELIENQQQEVSINLDDVKEPLGINIPVNVIEDLGNALETEATEDAGNEPVVGTTKLELESVDEINNHLETANVEEIAETIDEMLNAPVVQQQEVVPEDALKENMENVVVAGSEPSAEEANVQEVIDAVEDALKSQEAAQQSDSVKELENKPGVEMAADAPENVIKAEEAKTPVVQVLIEREEDQSETLPEPEKLEAILEAAETFLTEQEQKEETAMQVEQAMDEEPKKEALKQEEPKEEQPMEEKPKEEEPKEDESMKVETLDKAPAEEEQAPELSQKEKVELVQNIEEAKDEEPAKSDPIQIEISGELPKVEELKEEQEKTEEVPFSDNNKADQLVLEEAQILEEQANGENNENIVEESPMEQNNAEKLTEEEVQVNEQEEQLHEQFVEENLQEQAQVEPVIEALVQDEQKEEQHIVEQPQKEQQIVEEQKVEEEINNDETVPTIEVVAPTNNDLEPLNIVEEAQNIEVQDEEVLPEPVEAIEIQQNEDKTSLEIPEEIKEAAIEEQLMPVVDVFAAETVDQKEDETVTDNKEEEQLPEKVQQESELQTEEKPAAMQHETEVSADNAMVEEEKQEVVIQTNPNETTSIYEDKTEIAHEEENEKEVENPETNSMLTTIVQVPVQQLLPPVQDELQLSLLPPVQEAVKNEEEKNEKPIQMPAESVAIAKPIVQTPQTAEQAPSVVAQEQQQPPTQVIIEPATQKPLNVMDSVLNYVNASFAANVINSNYPIQQQQLQQQDNDDTYSSQLRRYDGAQVWRIVVQNDKDKKLADELQTKFDGQLWKEVKQEVDYLLKPQVLAAAARHIRAANLSRIVLIDNLQKVIEVENPPADEIALLQNRKGHRLTWQAYHRLEDIHGFFDYLAKTYPDICSVETIGYSLEKRPLKILKISNGNANNSGIWMDGGMHAREWISPASVTYVANQLVEGWDDLPENMRNINWYIHAVANPDGYEYTHTTDRLWRKNMRSHGRQCPGVDLNRNFGYKWGGKGTSANPCSQTYRGSKAFSEPETFYISKFISNYPRETFQAYLSFHSYGQYILYPWGYDYQVTKDRADLDRVARQAGTIITKSSGVKYTVGSSASTLYPAAGGSDDWAKGIAGIKFSYTIEMGDTGRYGFVLPANMIESNAQDAYTFVQTVASAVTNPAKWSRKRAI